MKKKTLFLCIGLFWAANFINAEAAQITARADGDWSSASTWNAGVPGDGDTVIINYDVTVSHPVTVGTGSALAVTIQSIGKLTIQENVSLTVKGNIKSQANIIMNAGSELLMSTNSPSRIILEPPQTNNAQAEEYPHLQINGTSENHCIVKSIGNGFTQITDNDGSVGVISPGGGRVVASFCDFSGLGGASAWKAIEFQPITPNPSAAPISFVDCTFNTCSRIRPRLNDIPAGANIEFIRCVWTDSLVDPAQTSPTSVWGIVETRSMEGATFKIINCDFDKKVGLYDPADVQIENSVFRQGINYSSTLKKKWNSFKKNFVVWPNVINGSTNFRVIYGTSAEDNIFVIDHEADNNPHFMMLEDGVGPINLTGNVLWYTHESSSSQGDGFSIGAPTGGTRAENTITIEKNIFLPNGNGPDGIDNVTSTGFTLIKTSDARQVIFNRNTLFVGSSTHVAGVKIGENQLSVTGDVISIKSNLFVGSRNNLDGMKIRNQPSGGSEQDVFLAGAVDYNGSYYLTNGDAYSANRNSGKGYDLFNFSGSSIIGAHDVDDENPQFFDPSRTPATWTDSNTLEATMDLLSPSGGKTMKQLLSYIRQGFQPGNSKFASAGDPGDGSPDIGAVDIKGSILNFLPAIISATKDRR